MKFLSNFAKKVLPASSPPTWRTAEGIVPRSTDVFIAVMGATGAGKSTFISNLTKAEVEIGHDIESCTQEVSVFAFDYNESTTVYLVDTPGFDDTNRTDTEVLRTLANWLTDSYIKQVKLNGIIYLHRITEMRMQGAAERNLSMFRKLCGSDALKNIVLATTMWELVEPDVGDKREKYLIDNPDFWGWMHENGSQIVRHQNSRDSALRIVNIFASGNTTKEKVDLGIQREMVNHGKTLNETDAGIELDKALAKERAKFLERLGSIKADMQETLKKRDQKSTAMLEEQKREMDRKLKRLDQERDELRIGMERLHEIKLAEMERRLENSRRENQKTQAAFEQRMQEQTREYKAALDAANQQRKDDEAKYRKEMDEREARMRREQEASEAAARKREEEAEQRLKALTLETKSLSKMPSQPEGKNRTDEFVSLTLDGIEYYWCGPVLQSWKTNRSIKEEDNCRNRYVAFGVSSSWYRHFHKPDGSCLTQRCGLSEYYPALDEWLVANDAFGCPGCVSLGPDGLYFAWVPGKGSACRLPDSMKDHLGPMGDVESVWLGMGGAYVAQLKDGTRKWNLNGEYPKLNEQLEEARTNGKRIKAIAMNPTNSSSAVMIWRGGETWFWPNDFPAIEWKGWSRANCGAPE